ncbi:phage portal protein family protein [Ornithobacterium rhinotracheale]|uniref:phage portal protein family protein n=1 Tax=Ornithobacterium rhinotracheale TaxID=28251 RepID=UPI004035F30A
MRKTNNRNTKQGRKKQNSYFKTIEPKAMAQTRIDVQIWKQAQAMAKNVERPKMFPFYNLMQEMMLDAHTYSQLQNRKRKTLSANFSLKKQNGDTHEELTDKFQKSKLSGDLISAILDAEFYGHSLIELAYNTENLNADFNLEMSLIPRQNVIPQKGELVKDYTDDRAINYREVPEFGTWLLEFSGSEPLGLLNKAVPHILFSRFAQSCWSELCEIYGIPPRVMKTNTQDPYALKRAEKMMMDMGAAAWFIIDDTEKFEFANTGTPASGEVYNGLIKLCRDNISLLISGAIIGQDTKYGSKGREESSQDILQELINADQTMVEFYMNDRVLPALARIGYIDEGLSFVFDQVDDLAELFDRTIKLMPYKNIPDDWIKDKFGVEVAGERVAPAGQNLSLDFFD